jgi:signal transduction histidine kinase
MDNRKILLVDDEAILLKSFRKVFTKEGYQVTTAASGEEAITALHNNRYDLVLTDLIMAGLDGIEVLKEAKRIDRKIGVIILTGYGDINSAIEALRIGADDYLLKPCDTDELLIRIARCREKRNLLRQLQEQNDELRNEITRRQEYEAALLKSSEKIKIFAYSVAHDLKNPAIAIYGLTKLINTRYKENIPEQYWKFCDQIMTSSEQIATLVDKINVYIATQEAPLRIENIQLNKVVQTIRDEFAQQLGAREIQWTEPADLPTIRADRIALLRVLRNLVDNALKYGGAGLQEIGIRYREADEYHVLSVLDDGIGIANEDCHKIFQLFERHQTSQGTEGTGLGLAIVKEIAEQHQGEVWAEPGPRKGITFHVQVAKNL